MTWQAAVLLREETQKRTRTEVESDKKKKKKGLIKIMEKEIGPRPLHAETYQGGQCVAHTENIIVILSLAVFSLDECTR